MKTESSLDHSLQECGFETHGQAFNATLPDTSMQTDMLVQNGCLNNKEYKNSLEILLSHGLGDLKWRVDDIVDS